MVKSKNIIAGLGVVAGLGMALLPLGAFAAETANNPSRTVRGVVGDVISIELTNDNKEKTDTSGAKLSVVDLEPGKLNADLVHTVKVTTNAQGGYDLKMAADHSDLRYVTSWDSTTPTGAQVKKSTAWSTTVTIPSVTAANTTLANLNDDDTTTAGAWGYKVKLSTASDYDTAGFNVIPTSATTIKTKAAPSNPTGEYNDSYSINYGIRPANTQLSGAYEATITYSAVTNAL